MTPVNIDEIERVVALNAAVGGTGAFLTAAQLVPLLAELRAARKVVVAAKIVDPVDHGNECSSDEGCVCGSLDLDEALTDYREATK